VALVLFIFKVFAGNMRTFFEGDEAEGAEETKPSNRQPKKEEPEGIVLGLVTTDIETEREAIKKKFLEKINTLRAKRNAPLVNNISELKESVPPKKKQKTRKIPFKETIRFEPLQKNPRGRRSHS
jgi:hypothetical protein